MKAMQERSSKSQRLIYENMQELKKKNKLKNDYFQDVLSKIGNSNSDQIQKAINLQKQIDDRNSRSFYRSNKSTIVSLKSERSQSQAQKTHSESVEEKISKLDEKSNRVQKYQEEQNKILAERIKQKTKNLQEAQKRALDISLQNEIEKYRSCVEKNEQKERLASISKNDSQKKMMDRKEFMRNKIDRCHDNLRQIQSIEQQKIEKLNAKFNRNSQPKQWKDHRLEKYRQKQGQNIQKIVLKQTQKAKQILQKHNEISLENRTYKQQKDKLIQAIKFDH